MLELLSPAEMAEADRLTIAKALSELLKQSATLG